jgi:hypothetical protein
LALTGSAHRPARRAAAAARRWRSSPACARREAGSFPGHLTAHPRAPPAPRRSRSAQIRDAPGPRAAPGQRHYHGALQDRKRPGSCRAPPVSQRPATARASTVIDPARCTAGTRKSRLCPGLYSDSATAPQGHRATGPNQTAFFLVSSLQALQVLWLAGSGERASPARRPDSNRSTVRLLLYSA